MIKNIIFDFAGVIMNLDIERDTKSLLKAGLPDWMGCLSNKELRHVLLEFLNGLMPWEEFLRAIKPFCKADVTEEEIYNAMHDVLDDVPASRMAWIKSLGKDYNIYLLSNISDTSWAICLERIAETGYILDECFDKVFLSYEMQLAKPDRRIYEEVIKATGIKPEETIYFDDTRENVEAGSALGINSILVKMNHIVFP